jgi:Cu-processing system ATP-binding protein
VLVAGRLVASLGQRQLADRLADRGLLRLRLGAGSEARHPGLLARVRELAPRAAWDGGELLVPCSAAERPAVLERLRAEGAEILALATEEGRLDGLYRELVEEASR